MKFTDYKRKNLLDHEKFYITAFGESELINCKLERFD